MSTDALVPDQRLGDYRLERMLARGGMAEVWIAYKEGLGGFSKQVVIKRVLPQLAHDAEFMAMFTKEARVAALFSHVNVVQIFELGESDGAYFIAMEFVNGCTLRKLQRTCFEKGVGLPLGVLGRILIDACEGLHYAHELKNLKGRSLELVHLDVSPENLLISLEGTTKVSDFGIARAREHTHSALLKEVLGKASYMPPEQAAGLKLDRRADIYALAVIAFEFITGQLPIEVDSVRMDEQQILGAKIDFSVIREVRPSLEPVLVRGLAADPNLRQRTAREFAEQLSAAIGAPATASEVARCLAELLAPDSGPQLPASGGGPANEVTRIRPTQRITEALAPARAAPQITPAAPQLPPAAVAGPRRRLGWGWIAAAGLSACTLAGFFWWRSSVPRPVLVSLDGAAGLTAIIDGSPMEPERQRQLLPGRHRLELINPKNGRSAGRWIEVTSGADQEVIPVTAP